ncbi:ABC-2 family transporter protein [Candidatus Microgenomates bacterium]|nr:ABC-2 family transporter protein [Candidatus Microgenomates bacterium]
MIIFKYIKVWYLLTVNSFSTALVSRFGAVLFFTGKLIGFFFFLLFLMLLVDRTQTLIGYSLWQVILFFLTFNLIDTISQFFFREVYRFRYQVVTGNFDLILVRPINPLFRALAGGADFLDLVTIPLLLISIVYAAGKVESITFTNATFYILLTLNGLVLSTAFHVLVLAIAILTTEIDHTIMIYRDITKMGRVPIDIYNQLLRGLLTFVVPVGLMMTFPVKALLGLLSWPGIIISFAMGAIFFFASLKLWSYSLRHYSSASS